MDLFGFCESVGAEIRSEIPVEEKAQFQTLSEPKKREYPPLLSVEDQVGVALAFHYMNGGAPVPCMYPIMELEERSLPKKYQGGNRAMLSGLAAAKFPSRTVRVFETADGKQYWVPTEQGAELAKACLI